MRRLYPAVWGCLALLLAAAAAAQAAPAVTSGSEGTATAAAVPRPTAGSACPPLLVLVEQLPESSIFAEILVALGASDEVPSDTVPLPLPTRPTARRLLSRRALAAGACISLYQPVCGKDGEIYSNACVAASEGAEVACEGECPCLGGKPCPAIYAPVCGVDGVSYDNDCIATGNETTAACNGPCPCEGSGTPCPDISAPVCGVDFFTYESACKAGATPIACKGACPCNGTGMPPADGGDDQVPATGGDEAMCQDVLGPVCGADGKNYTSACLASKRGVEPQCKGACPCPDLIKALETDGGMLLVPTDDSLLEHLNTTAGWMADTALLRQLLARHVMLTQNQPRKRQPVPSLAGTAAATEAMQGVRLFSSNPTQAARVALGGKGQGEEVEVLDVVNGCRLMVQLIEAPLEGPDWKGAPPA